MSTLLSPTDVAPGVAMLSLRTPTIPPATHTNAFLIGTGELAVIEPASPYAEELEQAYAWIDARLAAGQTLRALLLTHHHPDHIGGAEALRQRYGVPIWAHDHTARRLHGRLRIDRLLEDGERIELDGPTPMTLEAVFTPGHAPGHLCYLEPASGSLIAGDMVAGVGTILVETTDGDMQLYLDSLRMMASRQPQQLLPAHGLPITDPAARLAFYVQHRLAREAKIFDALVRFTAPTTVEELLPIAYADTAQAAWPFARLAIEAHLVKLEREGRAERFDARWRANA